MDWEGSAFSNFPQEKIVVWKKALPPRITDVCLSFLVQANSTGLEIIFRIPLKELTLRCLTSRVLLDAYAGTRYGDGQRIRWNHWQAPLQKN